MFLLFYPIQNAFMPFFFAVLEHLTMPGRGLGNK